MSYIGRCQLSGYKSIKDVSCEFNKGLNIIIGNNGSGKTNLLEFIYKILIRNYSSLDVFEAEIDINEYAEANLDNKKITWKTQGKINDDKIESERIVTQIPENKDVDIEFVKFNLPFEIPVLGIEYNPRFDFTTKRFLYND